jgi:TetR/AcrR family transcriptional regulator
MGDEAVRVRNPEGTRLAVLDAAERLFSERGFSGTSMRDIACASGVSQPLIHHHYGGKQNLYLAVRRRGIHAFATKFPDLAGDSDRPMDVRSELTRIFEFLCQNGSVLRLIGWARLEGTHPSLPEEAELTRAMVRRIELARDLGLVRRDVEPIHLSAMLLSLVIYWIENRSHFAEVASKGLDDEGYLQQAIALLEQGVAPLPAGETSRG